MPFPPQTPVAAGEPTLLGPAAPDQPYGPIIKFQTAGVLPPGALYLGPDDQVGLFVWSPNLSSNLTFSARVLRRDGTIQPTVQTFLGQSAGSIPLIQTFNLGEGFLLSMSIGGSAFFRGQQFVRAQIFRSSIINVNAAGEALCQGYVTLRDSNGYPGGIMESSLTGRGVIRNIIPAVPAPAAAMQQTVPAGVFWTIRNVKVFFQASAVVGTRVPFLEILDASANQVTAIPAVIGATASMQQFMDWAPGNTANSIPIFNCTGMPMALMVAGNWIIRINATNLLAGDQFSNGSILVEEHVGGL